MIRKSYFFLKIKTHWEKKKNKLTGKFVKVLIFLTLFQVFSHLLCTAVRLFCFADEKTNVRRGSVACPRSHS